MLLSSEQNTVPVYRHERLHVHAAPHLGHSASSQYANLVNTVSQSNRYMSRTSKPSGVRCPERSGASREPPRPRQAHGCLQARNLHYNW